MGESFDNGLLGDYLALYYKRLFPYTPFYKWLSYGNVEKNYFQHREFSFTLADDIYIRYQSFANKDEMVKEIQKRCPHKIDIGAVYTFRPKDHRTVSLFKAVEKELVFDIDMTDYDDIRTCCSGANVCTKCWKFLAIAVKIIDAALREDFGFEHLLWVFSGRRGIHCWVCDEAARKLSVAARSAVAEYLQVLKGGDTQGKKVTFNGDKLHPSIQRASKIINSYFEEVCLQEQDIFEKAEDINKVLQMVVNEQLRKSMELEMKRFTSSEDRWRALCKVFNDFKSKGELKKTGNFLLDEIKFQYTYPRLDINVSKGLNHLLKSPFCIHPKTGKVCIPFEPKEVDDFDPGKVPFVNELIEEINQYDANHAESQAKVKDYKKTRLYPSVEILEKMLEELEKTWKGKTPNVSKEF